MNNRSRMLRTLRAIPFQAKLIGAFLVVTLSASALENIISYYSIRALLIQETQEQLNTQAITGALAVGNLLDQQIRALQAISVGRTLQEAVADANARYPADAATRQLRIDMDNTRWRAARNDDPLVQALLNSSVSVDLKEYQRVAPDHIELVVTDRNGGVIGATDRLSAANQAYQVWWQAAWNNEQGQVYLGQPRFEPGQQAPVMDFAMPIRAHGSPEIIGVLHSTYTLAPVLAKINAIRIDATGTGQLMLANSNILTGQGAEIMLRLNDVAALNQLSSTPNAQAEYQGVSRFVALTPIQTSPEMTSVRWSMLVFQDSAEAFEPVTEALQTTLLTMSVLLVFSILLAMLVSRLLSGPIRRLRMAATQIAEGNLNQRLQVIGNDEIAQLARNFNHMSDMLEQRIAVEQRMSIERDALQSEIIRAQEELLNDLAIPLIPLRPTLLLLPLIGSFDARRIELFLPRLFEGVASRRVGKVILDLSGVRNMNEAMVEALLQAAQGVRLLGAQVVLVGIGSEAAQKIIEIGIDLKTIPMFADLQAAIWLDAV